MEADGNRPARRPPAGRGCISTSAAAVASSPVRRRAAATSAPSSRCSSGSRRRAAFRGFGGGRGGGQWASRGADQEARLQLTLEEAYHGGERSLTLTDPQTGQHQTVRVRIPEGVRPGQKIRLPGKGGRGQGGGGAGDLYLLIDVPPHPRFRLKGYDLQTTLPITPWEAALGGQARVETLDGTLTVKIPAGTPSGRKIRLRDKGFPEAQGGPWRSARRDGDRRTRRALAARARALRAAGERVALRSAQALITANFTSPSGEAAAQRGADRWTRTS